MSRCLIIWVGKARKNDPESLLCERYLSRVGAFVKITQHMVKPAPKGSAENTRTVESNRILALLHPGDHVILCDERGKNMSSHDLSKFISDKMERGVKRLVWVIGGSMGVSDSLRERAQHMLSLSKMTLTHALARVILTEQLYRAFCIRTGHPYHHEE